MKIGIKQATGKGYIECQVGGVADFSYPTSTTRRGRVQGGCDITNNYHNIGGMQDHEREH